MARDHWVPQFLLRKFTPSGSRDDLFWRYLPSDSTFEETKPYDVCWMDSLYGLDEQTIQNALAAGRVIGPRGLEEGFGREVENQASRVIQRIDRDGKPAKQSELDWLISFVSIQVIRTPYYMGSLVEHDDTRHNDILARALDDQPRVFDGLKKRHWTLARTLGEVCHFITSDNPVQLTRENGRNLDISPENFASKDSVVTMPLSQSLLLVGRNDGPRGATYEVDEKLVAMLNRVTLGGLCLEIYSPYAQFLVLHNDDVVRVTPEHPHLPWRGPSG